MNELDRIRNLEEKLGNIPARFAVAPSSTPDGLYQTTPDPGNNYPVPPLANTFYGKKVLPAFSQTVGNQGFAPGQIGGTANEGYILNLGGNYISQGAYIPCWNINGQLYTWVSGPGVFYGLSTAPSTGTGVPVYVTNAINGPTGFTGSFFQQWSFTLPNNWPVVGIGTAEAGMWLVAWQSLYQMGLLTTDIMPGGSGHANLTSITYGNVPVTDPLEKGGISGLSCKLFYTNGGWIIEDTSSCA